MRPPQYTGKTGTNVGRDLKVTLVSKFIPRSQNVVADQMLGEPPEVMGQGGSGALDGENTPQVLSPPTFPNSLHTLSRPLVPEQSRTTEAL